MKYIGIGLMWLAYAGVVTALAFAPKMDSKSVLVIAVIVGIALAIASAKVAEE